MDLKRGDIVTIAARGSYSGKPRPAVVVQTDAYNSCHDSVTVCPLTTSLVDSPHFRVNVAEGSVSALVAPSQAMVDKVLTLPVARVRPTGGRLDDGELSAINEALRRWLDL